MKIKLVVISSLLVAFAVGNFYKFSVISPDVHVSLLDIAVSLLTVVAIFRNKLKIEKYLVLFLGLGLISLIPACFHYGQSATLVGLLYLARFAVYALFAWTIKSLLKPEGTTQLILILGILLVTVGLGQYFLFPDVRALQVAEWDPHYFRVVGTLLDPGFMGIMLLLFMLFLTELKDNFFKIIWGFTYLAFILTYSRSSYLAYIVAMGFVAFKRKSLRLLLFTWLLLGISLPLLPRASSGEGVKLERTSSIQARITNWLQAATIFKEHPVLGVGFNVYRYAQNEYGFLGESKWLQSHAGAGADSSLLFVGATTGLIGLMAYLFYLDGLWKNSKIKPYLVAILVHSLFLNSLFYPFVLVFLALLTDCKLPSTLSESDSRPHPSR